MLLAGLTEEQAAELLFDWEFWARPEQLPPPGDWLTWLILTGRGWGKSRTGAEWVRDQHERYGAVRTALVGATAADVRDVMIEGPSGLLACYPPNKRPQYEPSKRRLTWPNGSVAFSYSADEPDRLRGPAHDTAWCDEICTWRRGEDTWSNLALGMRIGSNPRVVVTTTPRPIKLLKQIMAQAGTVTTRGALQENLVNLAPSYVAQIVGRYKGTRLGRQEIAGEILDDVPGALWTREMLDACRVDQWPDLLRVVVAIDPAVTSGDNSDDTGIVVAGLGYDGHGYVMADLTCHVSPGEWATRAVNGYVEYHADRIVGEVNNGGDMVETTIRTVDSRVPYKAVHASRGKRSRAEPVAALYEQGRAHHVGLPQFLDLEDQMCNFVPDSMAGSPDRVDALVWALTELMLGEPQMQRQSIRLVEPVSTI